jgi:hypothetical protein
MRLFEFDKQLPIKDVVKQYLTKGYEVIGQGASAMVLAHDNGDEIIKIGPASDCWLNITKVCDQSPHLPKVSSVEMHGGHYLAKVERLRPVKETFFKTGLFQCIAAWLYLNGNWKNGKDVYLNRYSEEQLKTMAADLETNKADIVKALKLILQSKGSCSLDMHPDNMMRRLSDNTLVFQDPLTDISHLK